jgi:starch phosphorylase
MYRILEKEIIPTYYTNQQKWMEMVHQSMADIQPYFDSDRMADEYYWTMYTYVDKIPVRKVNLMVESDPS